MNKHKKIFYSYICNFKTVMKKQVQINIYLTSFKCLYSSNQYYNLHLQNLNKYLVR